MKRSSNSIIIVGVLLAWTLPLFGELLDRIVAVIDDRFIITLSDIRKERAIQAAIGNDAGTDDAIADALIERHLVEEQIAQFRDIEIPEQEVTERLRLIGNHAGVSDDDLRTAVTGDLRRHQFMVERFEQFVRVSDDELLKYFNETYAPELRRRGEPVPPAEEGMQAVRQNVIALKVNEEVEDWLNDLKRRSLIEKISQ
jgi:parvulin-like peptidyl-prolyl isomerase